MVSNINKKVDKQNRKLYKNIYNIKNQQSTIIVQKNNIVSKPKQYSIGDKIEDFDNYSLVGLDGDYTIKSLYNEILGRNKKVLMVRWAHWCGPCRNLKNYSLIDFGKYKNHLTVILISSDESENFYRNYVENDTELADIGKIVHDTRSRCWVQYLDLWGEWFYPSSILLDENGTILATNNKGENPIDYINNEMVKWVEGPDEYVEPEEPNDDRKDVDNIKITEFNIKLNKDTGIDLKGKSQCGEVKIGHDKNDKIALPTSWSGNGVHNSYCTSLNINGNISGNGNLSIFKLLDKLYFNKGCQNQENQEKYFKFNNDKYVLYYIHPSNEPIKNQMTELVNTSIFHPLKKELVLTSKILNEITPKLQKNKDNLVFVLLYDYKIDLINGSDIHSLYLDEEFDYQDNVDELITAMGLDSSSNENSLDSDIHLIFRNGDLMVD